MGPRPQSTLPHGDGVPRVVGARESLVHGEGEQVIQWIDQLVTRDAPVFSHKRTGRLLETGEPDADESRTSGVGRGGWVRLQSLMELLLRAVFGK